MAELAILLAIGAALAVGSGVITAKLIDLLNVTDKVVKYILSAVSSVVSTLAVKFLGYSAYYSLVLLLNSGTEVPAAPIFPAGMSLLDWALVALFVFLISGGLFDLGFFKKLGVTKSGSES